MCQMLGWAQVIGKRKMLYLFKFYRKTTYSTIVLTWNNQIFINNYHQLPTLFARLCSERQIRSVTLKLVYFWNFPHRCLFNLFTLSVIPVDRTSSYETHSFRCIYIFHSKFKVKIIFILTKVLQTLNIFNCINWNKKTFIKLCLMKMS